NTSREGSRSVAVRDHVVAAMGFSTHLSRTICTVHGNLSAIGKGRNSNSGEDAIIVFRAVGAITVIGHQAHVQRSRATRGEGSRHQQPCASNRSTLRDADTLFNRGIGGRNIRTDNIKLKLLLDTITGIYLAALGLLSLFQTVLDSKAVVIQPRHVLVSS